MTGHGRRSKIGAALRGALPDRLHKSNRRSRGAAELSVLVVTGSLVAGVFFGQGLSQTAVDVADGLTWLSDDPSGEIIQVNPATGDLEVRRLVGNPGDDLEVLDEYGQQLYITDHTTGQLLALDLTSTLVSGQRRVSTGGAADTLTTDDGVFLVDTELSTISGMDPVTTDVTGTIWVAPAGLADAAVDGDDAIWALEDDGVLHRLTWSAERQAFDDEEVEKVGGSGPGSVLVAHDEGVTVFGPDQGLVAQVGTDNERTADAPKVFGKLFAPEKSPSGLVPVAASESGFVIILSDDGVMEVDMGSVTCGEPGTPEVFSGLIYVPCRGEGKVVRLDANGLRADDDIPTPGSDDPELVLDDDNLIINAPGADQGVVVHHDGSTTAIVRDDADIPLVTPTSTSTPPPPPPPDLLDDLLGDDDQDDEEDNTPAANGGNDNGGDDNGGGNHNGDNNNGGGNNGGNDDECDEQGDSPSTGNSPDPSDDPSPNTRGGKGGKGDKSGRDDDECEPPDKDPGPGVGQPVTAPDDVVAQAQPEGQVLVTWTHSGYPRADKFVVRSSDGETEPAAYYARQIYLKATPGTAATYTVSAVVDGEEFRSDPSDPVTTTARPGAPAVTAAAEYVVDDDEVRFEVEVTWTEADANGEPVTDYALTVKPPDGEQSRQADASDRSETFAWTCDRGDDPGCTVGGDYTVTVMASSDLGNGAPGTFSGKAPAQPPPPVPPANKQIVDGSSPKTSTADIDGVGEITLKLRPPNDWSRFPGTCTYVVDGASQPIECDARSVTIAYNNGPRVAPESGTVEHTVTFVADNGATTSSSAPFAFTSTQDVYQPQPQPDPDDPGYPGGPQNPPACYPVRCQIP